VRIVVSLIDLGSDEVVAVEDNEIAGSFATIDYNIKSVGRIASGMALGMCKQEYQRQKPADPLRQFAERMARQALADEDASELIAGVNLDLDGAGS
jgi:hypothetical protein